jgi:Flp pilus assembly protein TadD
MSSLKQLFLMMSCALMLSFAAVEGHGQAVGAGRGDTAGSGGSRSIQGRVFFPDRGEGKTIRITIESPDVGTRSTVTDPDGGFIFNNLKPNTYQVTVEGGPDYETYRESVLIEGALVSKMVVHLQYKKGTGPVAGIPDEALKFYRKGVDASNKNDTSAAIEQLQQALTIDPTFGLAQNELGMVYLRQGDFEKAITNFVGAQKHLPNSPMPFFNHGVVLIEQKKFSDAKKPLQEALKRNDKLASAHMYLGIAAVGLKDLAEAESAFLKAVKLGGDSIARSHYYLGGIYWAKKENKKAVDEMETYLKLRPNAPEADRLRKTIADLRKNQ